jgi:integrase
MTSRKDALPKYVKIANGRMVYRPYIPQAQRQFFPTDRYGYLKPPILLGRVGDDYDLILQAYLAAKASLTKQEAYQKHSLGWIMQQYLNALKPDRPSYKRIENLKRILDHPLEINDKPATLAHLHLKHLNKPLMQSIAQKRLDDYQAKGKKGTAQVNKEVALISAAITWAINFVHDIDVQQHPLSRFKKFKEDVNERHVTDEEYALQLRYAAQLVDWLPIAFELSYLLASRGVETLDIRLSHCTTEGITVYRRKGSRDNLILWTERLKAAYESALTLHAVRDITVADPYLLPNRDGSQLQRSSLSSYQSDLKLLMQKEGVEHVYWTMQELKAKGVSDSEDKTVAGHKTEAMRQRYDKKLQRNKAVK